MHIPSYVVELRILPFKYRTDVDPTVLQLHPLYEDEEGRVYMRGVASLHSVSLLAASPFPVSSYR